jgi:urease accessory protein
VLSALAALQHADSAFPSGGFAFSNGIEGSLSLPHQADAAFIRRYVEATLRHRWAGTDRVALAHAFRSAGDLARLAAVDQALEAASLAEPLRTGSKRAGRALLTTHVRLGTPGAALLRDAIAGGELLAHLPTMQGSLWHGLSLSEAEAGMIAGYQAVTGLASAAVRLGAIGAIEAQTIIQEALPILADVLARPVPPGLAIELCSFAPLVDIAALRAGSSAVRLFSN